MKPIVSIIVPVYNVEKYLEDCIDSLINQTYNKIEILLINDGSTDKSKIICEKYLKIDDRIKLINKLNGGLSDARNVGIDLATGEYLTFVDSDDVLSNKFIEKMLKVALDTKTDIVCSRYMRFKEKNKIIEAKENIKNVMILDSFKFLKNVFYQYDQTLYSVSACSKIYKKDIFRTLRYPKGKLYEDVAIISDLMEMTNKIAVLDEILYFYRISENSITNSKFNSRKLEIINYCEKNLQKYENNCEMQRAVQNMLFARSMEILAIMKNSKYRNKETEEKLWNNIKSYRKLIIFDNNSRKIAKISAIISYIGKNNVISLNLIYKKIKQKLNIQ